MKREVKFRGKCAHSDAWVYGNLIYYDNCETPDIIGYNPYMERGADDDWRTIPVDSWTIGQYTGLKDKNGREIYEGDIVKWAYDGLCYVVAFRSGMFFASAHELNEDVFGGYPLWMICEANRLCEIVGNIYDNKITK